MRGFAMLMSVSSSLTHPTGQPYDTQQMRGGGLMINMIHQSASNMTLVCNQPFENQKSQENVIVYFSTINSAITSKLMSLTTHLSFSFHFLSIKTNKVTWKTPYLI